MMEPKGNHYLFEELTDMILIYGECRKNQRQAAALYAQRFPDRRHADHGFFHRLCEKLKRNGQFYKSTEPIHVPQRKQEVIDTVHEALMENLYTSTRAIPTNLNMSHVIIHKIIKHSLGWHPFKQHTTQRFIHGNMPRRLNFCEWLIEHASLFKYLFLFFCCDVPDVVIFLLIVVILFYSIYACKFQ